MPGAVSDVVASFQRQLGCIHTMATPLDVIQAHHVIGEPGNLKLAAHDFQFGEPVQDGAEDELVGENPKSARNIGPCRYAVHSHAPRESRGRRDRGRGPAII